MADDRIAPSRTPEQYWNAAGLLAVVGGAFVLTKHVPRPYTFVLMAALGAAAAAAVAHDRLAGLLKNGQPERNRFGQGAIAGGATVIALIGLEAVPQMIRDLPATPMFAEHHAPLGPIAILGCALGISLQSRFLDASIQ